MKDKKELESGKASVRDPTPAPVPPIEENLFAPEVYADSAAFFALKSGNLAITFSSVRFDNSSVPGVAKHVTVGRLVMPIKSAQMLAEGLFDYLKRNNLIPDKAGAN